MMRRFCRYVDKVFHFGSQLQTLSDTRRRPQIPTAAVFASVWTLFATARGSLNHWEKDARVPARLRGIVGPRLPSGDTVGRVYAQLDSEPLRQMLSQINHQVRRNKALGPGGNLMVAAVDGHEFFASRKRCCPDCQTRTLEVHGKPVTEYYHRGVVCHLTGHGLALPLDMELQRPGEGEETTAKRLLERVLTRYERFIDVFSGDALYFDAPFINFCLDHHKDVIVVVKGDQRLLLQDAQQLFSQRTPGEWREEIVRFSIGMKKVLRLAKACRRPYACCIPRRQCGAAPNRRPGEGRDLGLVLGDDALQKPTSHVSVLASWTQPLGHRERLLQYAFDPPGVGPLFPASSHGDRELRSHVLHRLCAAAMLLAGKSQTGLPEADRELDRPVRRTLSGLGIESRALWFRSPPMPRRWPLICLAIGRHPPACGILPLQVQKRPLLASRNSSLFSGRCSAGAMSQLKAVTATKNRCREQGYGIAGLPFRSLTSTPQ